MRSPFRRLGLGLVSLLVLPVAAIKAAVARRRMMGHIAGFDDHLLRDIGLTRGDVDAVLADSMRSDPTLRLASLAYEARAGRRASALEQLQWSRMVGEAGSYGSAETDRRAA